MPNLEALSRLAQAWMTGTVDQAGEALLAERGLAGVPRRPVVIAGVSESDWGEAVIRRGAELACHADADLLVVHANVADGSSPSARSPLRRYQDLAAKMGGSYTEAVGESPARVLAEVVRSSGASRVVVARHRSRFGELLRGSVAKQLRRLLPDLPVEEVQDLV